MKLKPNPDLVSIALRNQELEQAGSIDRKLRLAGMKEYRRKARNWRKAGKP